ncbi:cAMP-responsive element modulator-like isoform X2 [Epinephelus fuscoguttatus]|uniref:cAMP-responsive element modulator-like isoform X2 n=1 Tax=Epinephelus fuscoguttatus TaxID=293821 RepID=UPI0020D0CB74|nr:cAMP-responsive element modulator-like isoform X2 [Epinephelus fuscoguttatus]
MAVTGDETETGTSGDMPACQLHNASSSLPQEEAETSTHSSLKHAETIEKRELRLMKNRAAARRCRVRENEYVDQMKTRIAALEAKNPWLKVTLQHGKKSLF